VNVLMIMVLRLYLAGSLVRYRAKLQLEVEKADLKSMYVQCRSKDGSCCELTSHISMT
jgi:hypothetical protein